MQRVPIHTPFGPAILAVLFALTAFAQAPAPQSLRPLGLVTAIDKTAKQITLKTDTGPELVVLLQEGAVFQRVAPGEKDLKNATGITFADIAVGDRILARGRVSEDQKTVAANGIIVMTKADIARKQETDRAEWQKRGVSGLITAVDAAAKQITINIRTPEGPKPLTITQAGQGLLRRYAPDSVKFSEAKPSAFADMAPGDQVRALGNKGADGSTFVAEELVSGSFRNIAATVLSLDAAANTIRITDLDTKKPVVVRINADSNLRRLPPQVAQMLAARTAGGPAGGAGAPAGAALRPGSGGPGGGPGGPGGMGRGGLPDIQQMIERMPAVQLADLKPGDAIIVSATKGADPAQVTAITLLAGVEPLLTSPAGRPMVLSNFMLDMNMGQP